MVEYIYTIYTYWNLKHNENTLDKVKNRELGESEIQTTYPKLKCSTIYNTEEKIWGKVTSRNEWDLANCY